MNSASHGTQAGLPSRWVCRCRLSRMRTSQPAASAPSTMYDPISPAPPLMRAVRVTLHNLRHDAMVASGSLRHDAACLAWLRCARAVGSPRDEGVVARLLRQPVGAPEGPGQIGAGVVNAHPAPCLAVVSTELDFLNTAVSGESSATDDRHLAGGKGL